MAASTNINGWNIGGNNNSFDQRGHFYRGVFSGNVTGMLVKQNSTPNMTVLVEHGSALLNKNTTSASIAEIKSDTSVTIDTANTSNPRIDSIVIYEDTSVAIPTVEANYWQDGAGGRFKIVSLPGTAAASPVALSDANIQTAIGAGKPWTRLADITVPTNSTTIINSNIADKRKIVSPNVSNYGTAGALSIDSNGVVSAMTTRFKATRSAAYSTVGNAATLLPFDTALWNDGGGFNTSTGKFTVPVSGVYNITAGVGLSSPTARIIVMIYVNNTERTRLFDVTSNAAYLTNGTGAVDLKLNAGDTVDVRYFVTNAGIAVVTGESFCWFSGRQV